MDNESSAGINIPKIIDSPSVYLAFGHMAILNLNSGGFGCQRNGMVPIKRFQVLMDVILIQYNICILQVLLHNLEEISMTFAHFLLYSARIVYYCKKFYSCAIAVIKKKSLGTDTPCCPSSCHERAGMSNGIKHRMYFLETIFCLTKIIRLF